MPPERATTGVEGLDRLLDGGLETDSLTELFGEAGSGKTIVCLAAAIAQARQGRWVAYLDTEGVSVDRLEAMAGPSLPEVLRHLLLATPRDAEAQSLAVRNACAMARDGSRPFGLIVLDSATYHYRLSLSGPEEEEVRGRLAHDLAELAHTALDRGVPVLLTNQVWRSLKAGTLEPVGGSFLQHVAKTIVRLDRLSGDRRRATLLKHRALPERSADLRITAAGMS